MAYLIHLDKDEINRLPLINDIEYGMLKILDLLESMILAKETMHVFEEVY